MGLKIYRNLVMDHPKVIEIAVEWIKYTLLIRHLDYHVAGQVPALTSSRSHFCTTKLGCNRNFLYTLVDRFEVIVQTRKGNNS